MNDEDEPLLWRLRHFRLRLPKFSKSEACLFRGAACFVLGLGIGGRLGLSGGVDSAMLLFSITPFLGCLATESSMKSSLVGHRSFIIALLGSHNRCDPLGCSWLEIAPSPLFSAAFSASNESCAKAESDLDRLRLRLRVVRNTNLGLASSPENPSPARQMGSGWMMGFGNRNSPGRRQLCSRNAPFVVYDEVSTMRSSASDDGGECPACSGVLSLCVY